MISQWNKMKQITNHSYKNSYVKIFSHEFLGFLQVKDPPALKTCTFNQPIKKKNIDTKVPHNNKNHLIICPTNTSECSQGMWTWKLMSHVRANVHSGPSCSGSKCQRREMSSEDVATNTCPVPADQQLISSCGSSHVTAADRSAATDHWVLWSAPVHLAFFLLLPSPPPPSFCPIYLNLFFKVRTIYLHNYICIIPSSMQPWSQLRPLRVTISSKAYVLSK